MKPAIFLFLCTAIVCSCAPNEAVKDDLINEYMKEDFLFIKYRLKYEMAHFEMRADENPEKFGSMLESARVVSETVLNFSTLVDSLVERGQITTSEIDSLKSSYIQTFQVFQEVVYENPTFLTAVKKLTDPFPQGYSDDHKLNLAIMRNQMGMMANDVVRYMFQDMDGCHWGFTEIKITPQKIDSNHTTALSLSSEHIQQFPHKYIFVNEIKRNGQSMKDIKYKTSTIDMFGQITLDSLPPANYEISGQVRGVTQNDRYYEKDFSYAFEIE